MAPRFDQENDDPDGTQLLDEEIVFDGYMHQRLAQFDDDLEIAKEDFIETLYYAALPVRDSSDEGSTGKSTATGPDELLLRRTNELWAGLRRVYFGEVESPSDSDDAGPSAKRPRTRENVAEFKREIAETLKRIRHFEPRVPDALDPPIQLLPHRRENDDDEDPDPLSVLVLSAPEDYSTEFVSESSLPRDASNGELGNNHTENGELENGEGSTNPMGRPIITDVETTIKAGDWKNGEFANGEGTDSHFSNQKIPKHDQSTISTIFTGLKILSVKTMRRILNFKESLMKYGLFLPKNDNEADASPECVRWGSGRQLEWIRLQTQGTFERNWDWVRVHKIFPLYQKRDIGHVFFVYDYKYSGEHRVRLVFDGSCQNPETYTDTYAPTARGESVRLFHIFDIWRRRRMGDRTVRCTTSVSQVEDRLRYFRLSPQRFCGVSRSASEAEVVSLWS